MAVGILDLPVELVFEIAVYLNYPSSVALRLSCRSFYNTVKGPSTYNMTDLLEMELWPFYHPAKERPDNLKCPFELDDFFACNVCLKLIPALNFSNAMMRGKRGKLSNEASNTRATRFCIQCGVRTGRYIRGTQFDYGGIGIRHGLVCKCCGRFKEFKSTSQLKQCYDCLKFNNLLKEETERNARILRNIFGQFSGYPLSRKSSVQGA
ncbi:hypothetical protein H072_8823 [Dactylellina haptotyla CBS 200.50]|uniref:F-box domain-containing protein n=1 Tax=Dactylellina haptotyla (strain CBS 200.50) TaxID=1284197 RepID=S8BE63_DACHA|nr:hypothetical protein H072_8823 [Dactylellina haptotyla CBS 200.50]